MDNSTTNNQVSNIFQAKTKRALLWMKLSHEPFVVLYVLLPFILRKDLNASILQITILSAIRPIIPLFSFYWSANLTYNRESLRSNLIGAWVLGRLPFLFVPWFQDVWYLIFCCAVYEFFNKSGIPALIEILKINLPEKRRESSYMLYFMLSFIESVLLGFIAIWLLGWDESLWPVLLCLATLVGLSSIFFQLAVPIQVEKSIPLPKMGLINKIKEPWKDTLSLLKIHPDFARFQYGFMLGGFSLMLVSPSLSIYYVHSLNLTHSSVVAGRSILMAIGIVLSSRFWQRFLSKEHTGVLTQWILFGFSVYLLLMIFANYFVGWFFIAFLFYGIAQAGSHLLWNFSGILFSADGDSSPFSRLNILMLGIRGIFAPALGGILCNYLGPKVVLFIGSGLCLMGVFYMRYSVVDIKMGNAKKI